MPTTDWSVASEPEINAALEFPVSIWHDVMSVKWKVTHSRTKTTLSNLYAFEIHFIKFFFFSPLEWNTTIRMMETSVTFNSP